LTDIRTWNGRPYVNLMTDIGAPGKGDPSVDETRYMDAAFQALARVGGGTIVVPDPPGGFYNQLSAWVPTDGVTVEGVGGRPVFRNTNASGSQTVGLPGAIALPGNFHPAFTGEAVYYRTGPIAAGGRQTTLVQPASAARFRRGAKVYVTSVTWALSGGFKVFDYAWLNVATEAGDPESGIVSLEYPLDVALPAAQICLLAANPGRGGIPLFFWKNGGLKNVALENLRLPYPPHVGVIGDQACLDCVFEDVAERSTVTGSMNSQQRCRHTRRSVRWSMSCLEMAQNCLQTTVEQFTATYEPAPGVGPLGPLTIHEHSRRCDVSLATLQLGDLVLNGAEGYIASLADCAHCSLVAPKIVGEGGAFPAIYVGGAGGPGFAVTDNVVSFADVELKHVLAWVVLDGGANRSTTRNGVEAGRFLGQCVNPAVGIISLDNEHANFLKRNWFGSGQFFNQLQRAEAFGGLLNEHNYFEDGFADESGADATRNHTFGASSAAWQGASALDFDLARPLAAKQNAPLDVYDAPLTANVGHITGVVEGATLTVTSGRALAPGIFIGAVDLGDGAYVVRQLSEAGVYRLSKPMRAGTGLLAVRPLIPPQTLVSLEAEIRVEPRAPALIDLAFHDVGEGTETRIARLDAPSGPSRRIAMSSALRFSPGSVHGIHKAAGGCAIYPRASRQATPAATSTLRLRLRARGGLEVLRCRVRIFNPLYEPPKSR
jgi:hypothetical protein